MGHSQYLSGLLLVADFPGVSLACIWQHASLPGGPHQQERQGQCVQLDPQPSCTCSEGHGWPHLEALALPGLMGHVRNPLRVCVAPQRVW